MRIDTNQDGVTSVIVTARVKKKEGHRCPFCGRKCPGYDQGSRKERQQRALDMCGLLLFIETKEERIICSEHGVQYPTVLWAYGQTVHEGFRHDGSMEGLPSPQEGCQGIPQDRLGDGGGADIFIQHDAGRLKFRFRFFEALLI